MKKYVCSVCGYVYDLCGVGKDDFEPAED